MLSVPNLDQNSVANNSEAILSKKTTLWASFGSVIEYYDFVAYGMMAKYLGQVFFPSSAHQDIQALLIFAVGYLARPFGGILIGMIGDRYGRRPAFLFSTSLMALSTLGISCLPTFENSGAVACYLLAFFRLLQGLSFGGEFPGAATLVGEFATTKNRGWRCSLIIASTSIGAVSATAVLSLLTSALTDAEILNGGWRIPFLIGGCAGLILFGLRWGIAESPTFVPKNQHVSKIAPLLWLMRSHPFALIKAMGLTLFPAAMVIINLYFPTYLSTHFSYKLNNVYSGITLSLIFSALIVPLCGKLADRLPKRKLTGIACGVYILLSIPLFSALSSQSSVILVLFLMIHQAFIALSYTVYLPLVIDLFPPETRYTGIGTSYNLTFAGMALLPSGVSYLLGVCQNLWILPLVLALMAVGSLVTVRLLNIANQR